MSLLKILLTESLNEYKSDGFITLYHYSTVDQDTVVLSPDRFGKHSFTKADKRLTDYPRVFFYLNLDDTERFFKHKNLYATDVPHSAIYNVLEDPQGIKDEIKEKNNGVLNFDELLRTIHNRGFKGMYYQPKMDIVIWFEPIEVSKYEFNNTEEAMDMKPQEVQGLTPTDIIEVFNTKEVAILSAERGENTEEENTQRSLRLKSDLRSLPYKFTTAYGGFVETDRKTGEKVDVEEKSFMVWTTPENAEQFRKDMIQLGNKYNQEAILIKQYDENQAYFTSSGTDKDYVGQFRANKKSEYFTRIGDFYFVFG